MKGDNDLGRIIKGVFSKNRRGFGFVEIADSDENERDIYIAPADQKDAMTGDTVTVDLIPEIYWEGSRPEGIITKIDRRSITHVTGTYIKRKKYSVVLPISEKEGIPVLVNRNDSSGAGSGDKVTVEILKYPEKGRDAVGRVVAIIAGKDDPAGDIKALIRSKNLSFSFPDEVKSQASDIEKAGITAAEIEGRRDLRERNIFTIDGADSKDFDDAVSVNMLDNGNYLLGVHIADVSHYVTEDSPLDREALKRGNSVYVLNQVVPMLPVELSNGICSLNEGVERLTLTCEMEVSPHGDVVSHDIFESVICSKHRLVYNDISDILEKGDEKLICKYQDIYDDLLMMRDLYEVLADKRDERGSIDFDVDEAYIRLDENGIPISVDLADRRTANRLIEEFMLLANETVAQHFYWLQLPFIFRVHEKPEAKKMTELKAFLDRLGIAFRGNPANIRPGTLSDILRSVKGSKYENVVSSVTLRSMQKAYYSTDCGGHFGLSLKYYTHFTSPIRRYPDLFIHRVIKSHIHGEIDEERMEKLAVKAVTAADISSVTERNATEIERTGEKMKKAQYMSEYIGDIFEGIISGVTSFGFFVQLPNTIEGLVRLSELDDDYYETDESSYSVTGEMTGNVYKLGDKIRVMCIAANRYSGEIDFKTVSAGKRKKRKRRK